MNKSIRAAALAVLLPLGFSAAASAQNNLLSPSTKSETDLAPEQSKGVTTFQQDWQQAIKSANAKMHLEAMKFAHMAYTKFSLITFENNKKNPVTEHQYVSEFGINPMDFYHEQVVEQIKENLRVVDQSFQQIERRKVLAGKLQKEEAFAASLGRDVGGNLSGLGLNEKISGLRQSIDKAKALLEESKEATEMVIKKALEAAYLTIRADVSRELPTDELTIRTTLEEAGIKIQRFYFLCALYGADVPIPGGKNASLAKPEAYLP